MEGTIKFYNAMKNFGFVTGEDGKDYFVHSSAIKSGGTLKEGDKVKFEVIEGDKGPKADKVEKV